MKELKNSREIFTVVELNIRIRGNIFHIYSPISWNKFPSINNDKRDRKRPRLSRRMLRHWP